MRKLILILCFICKISTAFSQSGWQETANYSNNILYGCYFINENVGFVTGLANGTKGIIYKTTNGGFNWTSMFAPAQSGFDLMSTWFINSNTGFIVGKGFNEGIVLKTTNQGVSWINLNMNNDYYYDVTFSNESTGFISAFWGVILKTTNGGMNWVQKPTGTTSTVSKITFSPENNNHVFAIAGSKFLYSTNGGENWPSYHFPDSLILMDISFANDNIGYVSGRLLPFPYTPFIYKTLDGGHSWIDLSQNAQLQPHGARIFFIDKHTGFITAKHISKTTDGGHTWKLQEDAPIGRSYHDIYFTNSNIGMIVAMGSGLYNGLILRTNTGGEGPPNPPSFNFCRRHYEVNKLFWSDNSIIEHGYGIQRKEFSDSVWQTIDTVPPNSVTYNDSSSTLNVFYRVFSFNEYGNSFSNEMSPILVEVSNNSGVIPGSYDLYQNFPNPFNPSTNIRFDIPVSSDVKLAVYDLLGREVSSLVDGQLSPGRYEYSFDGSNLASGVYIYRLKSGDFNQTKKMFLIK